MSEKLYLKELVETKGEWQFKYLKKAIVDGQEKDIEELEKSGLRGRGGAAFPSFIKWRSVMKKEDVVLICNADEGEPGTFKDRYIMETNPFLLIESLLIAAYMLDAKKIFIYLRGEYTLAEEKLRVALEKSDTARVMFSRATGRIPEIKIIMGGGAYVCGDETSLINSLEGTRPSSRIKPPLPVDIGYKGLPTVVNNVETLCNLPLIIRDGGEGYSKIGTEVSAGTKLIALSGKVNKPGVYEVEMGSMTIREIINELGGGVVNDNIIKFVIPGGVSTQMLSNDELDITLDFESLAEAGSAVGSGAMIVADETVDTYYSALSIADFFMHETCGTCYPCKEGNRQVFHLLHLIGSGKGTKKHLELIERVTNTTSLSARCGLGKSTGNFITSSIQKIPEDYLKQLPESEQI
jgi:NADH-quinone oxidoreductase subunit F